jgi:hypothetical protein
MPATSDSLRDEAWDAFLQGTALGHFQQSAMWSRYKRTEGWLAERVVYSDEAGPSAGFQLLWRPTRLGRIGYISKGPAARNAGTAPWTDLTRDMIATATRLKLQALMAQAPDWAPEAAPIFRQQGFIDNHLYAVIRATLLIDLSPGTPCVQDQFRKGARRAVQQVLRDGCAVREGDGADLPEFFRMMRLMCRRLGTPPNPGSEGALRSLWKAFHNQGLARLLVAVQAAQVRAGLLLLRFGNRMTAWKQACDPATVTHRPDPLLFAHAIRLAIDTNCRWFDFAALDPEAARALERGEDLSRDRRYSRDFFHIGFGGRPLQLPEPLVWFRSAPLRQFYRVTTRLPGFRGFCRFVQPR